MKTSLVVAVYAFIGFGTNALAEQSEDASVVDAQCSANLAAGISPGVYKGEAIQRETGRDGSHVVIGKALTLSVDAQGCVKWSGDSSTSIAMPGERSGETTFCHADGTATLAISKKVVRVTGQITQKSGGNVGQSTQHVWDCHGHIVRIYISGSESNLRLSGCRLLGNDSGPGPDLNNIGCMYDESFKDLKNTTLTRQKDGSLRLMMTVLNPGAIVLRKQ